MKVFSIISQKGGSGKTTLAIHLSVVAELDERRVVLVDLDPQQSATGWHESRDAETPLLAQCTAGDLPDVLHECRATDTEIVIIDTAPHNNPEAIKAARESDFVLIPCRPTILDLRAIGPSVDVAKTARVPACIVFSACPPQQGKHEPLVVREAREAVMEYGTEIFTGQITQRVAFSHALIDGRAVLEFEPSGKASLEIRALWEWITDKIVS